MVQGEDHYWIRRYIQGMIYGGEYREDNKHKGYEGCGGVCPAVVVEKKFQIQSEDRQSKYMATG